MNNAANPVDPEKERRKIKSVGRMKEIMTHYYIDAKPPSRLAKKWPGSPAAGRWSR